MLRITRFAKILGLSASLGVLALMSGCSDDDDQGSTPVGEPGTLERLFSYPVIQGCATCHGPNGEAAPGFHLTKSNFEQALVNRNARDPDYDIWFNGLNVLGVNHPSASPLCGATGFYIVPGDPNASQLLPAISEDYTGCEGTKSYHETVNGMINAQVLADLELWITNLPQR